MIKEDDNMRKRSLACLLGVFVVALGICFTTFVLPQTPADAASRSEVNSKGMTFGSASMFDYEEEPNLILVVATNGKEGYVKRDELHAAEAPAANPEEAVQLMETRNDELSNALARELNAITGQSNVTAAEASAMIAIMSETPDPTHSIEQLSATNTQFMELSITEEQFADALDNARTSLARSIPVYEQDGTTVIGTFLVG